MSKVIILEELDFEWDKKDIALVNRLWKQGEHLKNISKAVNRNPEETFLLLMNQARKGRIQQRENYIWGIK